jgi:predicted site-specific integrase-resolvase
MEKLLTKQELADRWQVTVRTIENWISNGLITPIKSIPVVRFNPTYIEELEGVKLEKFSPVERKKLERQLEKVTQERDLLKVVVGNILRESSKVTTLLE